MIIEVAYALPDEAFLKSFEVDENATIIEVINQSGVLQHYPEIDLTQNQLGIFGKVVTLEEPLRNKDRIEIYRPLIADPKEVRKRKALERQQQKELQKQQQKNSKEESTQES
jgi:putative ubiquitin-RnfH superfamily antitoxin RatB of RatAB toxin-antitoxin module